MIATISLIKGDSIGVDVRNAALLLNDAIEAGFAAKQVRPVEFGGDMGTHAIIAAISEVLTA